MSHALKSAIERVDPENITGKRENAGYQFFFFLYIFKDLFHGLMNSYVTS